MEKIANKCLLAVDKFILQLHLRQSGFTYSTFGLCANHHERIKKVKDTDDLNFIYNNELDKTCFANDAVYADIEN